MRIILSNFLLILLVIGCSNGSKDQANTDASIPNQENEFPSFDIEFIDGTKQSVKKLTGKVALILFQPDCDHCQREAQDIKRNLTGFKGYKLYFISSASKEENRKFSKDYGLDTFNNVFFAHTASQNIVNAFGPIDAPSLYLYGIDGKLIQAFNGEIAIEVVLKYI
jgi:peroxiredoxin